MVSPKQKRKVTKKTDTTETSLPLDIIAGKVEPGRRLTRSLAKQYYTDQASTSSSSTKPTQVEPTESKVSRISQKATKSNNSSTVEVKGRNSPRKASYNKQSKPSVLQVTANRTKKDSTGTPSYGQQIEDQKLASQITPKAKSAAWLGLSDPAVEEQIADPQFPSPQPPNSAPDIESMSSMRRASGFRSESASTSVAESGASTVKARRRANHMIDKLSERRVKLDRVEDPRTSYFSDMLHTRRMPIRFSDIGKLRTILEEFIADCDQRKDDDDAYQAVEDLFNNVATWKPDHQLIATTNVEFQKDKELSEGSNEAILQRTVMTSIIDRWQLPETFRFNCEAPWTISNQNRVPTSGSDESISNPKPDLAIFFNFDAVSRAPDASIPADIRECLNPDGLRYRCFPFLFIEAKKGKDSLDPACLSNFNSASQALYNIYRWMEIADMANVFFEKVRVFTIVLNAQELSLRVHRAKADGSGKLWFCFDDIDKFTSYDRDGASLLVQNILREYAQADLLPILQKAFQIVLDGQSDRQKAIRLWKKIKATTEAAPVSPALSEPATPDNPIPSADPNLSFGESARTGALSLEDPDDQ